MKRSKSHGSQPQLNQELQVFTPEQLLDLPAEKIFYFGYGSNICHSKLKTRKMDPDHCPNFFPARLKDFNISFAVPGLYLVEPSFAGVVPKQGSCVYGLVIELPGGVRDFIQKLVETLPLPSTN